MHLQKFRDSLAEAATHVRELSLQQQVADLPRATSTVNSLGNIGIELRRGRHPEAPPLIQCAVALLLATRLLRGCPRSLSATIGVALARLGEETVRVGVRYGSLSALHRESIDLMCFGWPVQTFPLRPVEAGAHSKWVPCALAATAVHVPKRGEDEWCWRGCCMISGERIPLARGLKQGGHALPAACDTICSIQNVARRPGVDCFAHPSAGGHMICVELCRLSGNAMQQRLFKALAKLRDEAA